MELTQKDETFLETLKILTASKDLWVELKPDRPSCMILRGTYGDKVHSAFRMTRQGVRWRFWRIYDDIYVSAFEAILSIERAFGTQLREHAIRISKERFALRQEITRRGFQSADTLQKQTMASVSRSAERVGATQTGSLTVSDIQAPTVVSLSFGLAQTGVVTIGDIRSRLSFDLIPAASSTRFLSRCTRTVPIVGAMLPVTEA